MNLDFATDKFVGMYRGQVLDNNDPDKLGRIKVNLFGLTDGIDVEDLPWSVPAMPLFAGAGSGFGYFAIPELNTFVWCFFEALDIYQPVYFAEATDGIHGLPAERLTNYPNTKVIKTKSEIIITVNDLAKTIRLDHPTGAYILIDGTGNIQISGTTVHINP